MTRPLEINLEGKIILVTGGYSHLGSATAESLLHHGAEVYVLGRNREKFSERFGGHPEADERLRFRRCDVSRTDSIREAFRAVNEERGRLDVLINNANYARGQSPEEMSDDDWAHTLDGVLSSVFRCIREIIPYFTAAGEGKIINVSSMYGVVAPDFRVYEGSEEYLNPPHYEASKAGVLQLTRYYASYLGSRGVTVNAVTPGPFPKPSIQRDESFMESLAAKTCLGRIGRPEEVAGAFVFLASEAANYITGQEIRVDGGWTAT